MSNIENINIILVSLLYNILCYLVFFLDFHVKAFNNRKNLNDNSSVINYVMIFGASIVVIMGGRHIYYKHIKRSISIKPIDSDDKKEINYNVQINNYKIAQSYNDIKKQGNINIKIEGNPDIKTEGNPDIKTEGNPDIKTEGDIKEHDNTNIETEGNSNKSKNRQGLISKIASHFKKYSKLYVGLGVCSLLIAGFGSNILSTITYSQNTDNTIDKKINAEPSQNPNNKINNKEINVESSQNTDKIINNEEIDDESLAKYLIKERESQGGDLQSLYDATKNQFEITEEKCKNLNEISEKNKCLTSAEQTYNIAINDIKKYQEENPIS